MSIGEIIKNRRKELGMSAEDVAEIIGASPATIYRYESNYITKMGIDKLTPIARALRVSEAYLMGWTTDPNWRPESDISSSSPAPLQLTEQEEHLVVSFRSLNEDGRDRAISYVDDLSGMDKYRLSDLEAQMWKDADEIVREEMRRAAREDVNVK